VPTIVPPLHPEIYSKTKSIVVLSIFAFGMTNQELEALNDFDLDLIWVAIDPCVFA
jgi:hypothetical protein